MVTRTAIGILLLITGIFGLFFVAYSNSKYRNTTRSFSPYTLISSSWVKYKEQFINQDGRVIDTSRNNITTSEGQSYAMLRSVWIDDKPMFDLIWKWTRENLKRSDDNLFGWRWGEREDKSFGFLKDGGDNAAADADTDIALALILASRRWGQPQYEDEAKKILKDIWTIETDEIQNKRFLIAGNWARGANTLVLNPSYFAPYAWRIFADIDKENNWNSLIDPAYELLFKVGQERLDRNAGVGLPPDWVSIERSTGNLKATGISNLSTNYSYDAIRTPWRIALDYQWFGEDRARSYLENSFNFLYQLYQKEKKLVESYSHDGSRLLEREGPSMYATSLSFLSLKDPNLADLIYQEKIIRLYSNDTNTFSKDLPYFDQNWLWFGAASFNKQLSNFR